MGEIFSFPKHLQKIIHPVTESSGDSMLHGTLRCTCGSETFVVTMFAEPQKDEFLQEKEYEGTFALCVKAKCAECAEERLIFDRAKHGYDAFVWGSAAAVPDFALEKWHCPVCGGERFRLWIAVELADREELIADGFSEKTFDFSEMFGWITIGLACTGCSHTSEGWLDLETM